jgi:hypothetical protein
MLATCASTWDLMEWSEMNWERREAIEEGGHSWPGESIVTTRLCEHGEREDSLCDAGLRIWNCFST